MVSEAVFFVLSDEVVDESVVKVFTAKVSITCRRQVLEDTVVDGEEGDIKCSTTEVVDYDVLLIATLAKSVGNSGSGGPLISSGVFFDVSSKSWRIIARHSRNRGPRPCARLR